MQAGRLIAAAWALAGVLAGCAGTPSAPPGLAELPSGVTRVGEGAYVFESGSARSLFLIGNDSVIVTDPLSPAEAGQYLAAIRAMTKAPVRYVVYSHNHWNRILGASVFTAEGAKVVAQERCVEFFRMNPNPAVVMPDITFADGKTLDAGGVSLELRYFGPVHGDCLSVFRAKPANVVQVVDMVDIPRGSLPADPLVPNLRPHHLLQFFAAADQYAAAQKVTGVVGSSTRDGAPAVGSAAAIHEQREFWEHVYETVEAAEARGAVGNDSMPRLRPEDFAVFQGYAGFDRQSLLFTMRRIVAYDAMGR